MKMILCIFSGSRHILALPQYYWANIDKGISIKLGKKIVTVQPIFQIVLFAKYLTLCNSFNPVLFVLKIRNTEFTEIKEFHRGG